MEDARERWNRTQGFHSSVPLEQLSDPEYGTQRSDRNGRDFWERSPERQQSEFVSETGYSWMYD